jgi:acyl transferase domain-containing protein
MFSGQGAQYVNMGQQLYQTENTFRGYVDSCSELIKRDLGFDLRELLFPASPEGEASFQLAQTRNTQPALFVFEYALAMLLMEWGIRPQAMIGHSIGEYVAACLAGCLSLEQALRVVVERGRLMQQAPTGSMLAVSLPEKEVRLLLPEDLDVASINEDSTCVVAGPTAGIEAMELRLARERVACRRLQTSHAFHTRMMDCVVEPFRQFLNRIEFKPPKIPYISNLTGFWVSESSACSPDCWARHLREPVRFAEGVRTLLREHNGPFIEVGPGQSLASFVRQHSARRADQSVLSTVRHRQARESDSEFLLNTLARLWLVGVEVDWAGFHRHERLRRVHLPTYPFERQRYWVSSSVAEGGAEAVDAEVKRADLADWFYVPSWERSATPESSFPNGQSDAGACWLILEDRCGLGEELAACVRERGKGVVTVKTGERFAAIGECSYEIDPGESEHYKALLGDLRTRKQLPSHVVHLWSVSGRGETHNSFDQQQRLGFYSLLFLAQALIAEKLTESIQIAFVCDQVHLVTGEEQLCPEKAPALGACKSIPQEYPNLRCRAIDVDLVSRNQPLRRMAEQLLAELSSEPTAVDIAYRDGHRWARVFEPTRLGLADSEIRLLREGGVYLITGGLGNVGLAIAEELTRWVRARVALMGRSEFPPRREWERWIKEKGEGDPLAARIRRLLAMEESGGEVLVLRADVSEEREVREAIDQIDAQFGALQGVIHGAGNVSPEGFFAIDLADQRLCNRQFASKIHGLRILERVLRGENLDFWLLLSSISSVLAGLGYVAYSAANIFLDSFASERSLATGIPWISVNWDTWDFSETPEAESSHPAILPREGVDALRRILCWSPLPQVVVSVSDLETRLDQWIRQRPSHPATSAKAGRASHLHVRPELGTPYVAPRNDLERTITGVWQELLGISEIGIHDNFFSDLSGSSLLATQLVARLRALFSTDLPLRRFFECPTVAELAAVIQQTDTKATSLAEKFGDHEAKPTELLANGTSAG